MLFDHSQKGCSISVPLWACIAIQLKERKAQTIDDDQDGKIKELMPGNRGKTAMLREQVLCVYETEQVMPRAPVQERKPNYHHHT
jgi:hypothetical protein